MSLASEPSSAFRSERHFELARSKTGAEQADFSDQAFVVQKYAYVLEACGEIFGKRVLDVGFGNGDLARIFDRLGGDVTAFDVVATRISQLREDAPTVAWWQGDISTWKQPRHADPFDLIVACETLQFVEFNSAVRRFRDVLSDHGRIVVVIPNADCPMVQRASQSFENKYTGISMQSLDERLRGLARENYVAYRGIYLQDEPTMGPYHSGPWKRIPADGSSIPTPHIGKTRTGIPHRLQVVICRSGPNTKESTRR